MRAPTFFSPASSDPLNALGTFSIFSIFCVLSAALLVNPASAQAPQKAPAVEQRAERIDLKDAGARVQELRVGGQTQSITVQPQGQGISALPAYEVQPTHGKNSTHGQSRSNLNDTTGPRVWNVLKF